MGRFWSSSSHHVVNGSSRSAHTAQKNKVGGEKNQRAQLSDFPAIIDVFYISLGRDNEKKCIYLSFPYLVLWLQWFPSNYARFLSIHNYFLWLKINQITQNQNKLI